VSLTHDQLATLGVAVNRIVPADDYPSASEAGVLDFLTRIIESENLEGIYREGLDGLDREAQFAYEVRFEQLRATEQDRLLTDVEAGRVQTAWAVAPQEFFELLARQTVEGYYADPANGGNRDEIAWKMVGFRVTS